MVSFPNAALSEPSSEEGLDPLFLRRQSLSEDLRRWSALESRLLVSERATLVEAGLSERQVAMLRLVALDGGRTSVKALLLRMRVSKQNLSHNLTRLQREGYVRKAGHDRHDRRVRVVALTAKGLSFADGLLEPRARLLTRAYRSADAAHVEGFRRTLLLLSEEEAE